LDVSAVLIPDNITRTTRQAINGRQNALYDTKYHPLDDFTAPAKAAAHRRRLGLPEPDKLPNVSEDQETESEGLSGGSDFSEKQRPSQRVAAKGTRQSDRVSTRTDKGTLLYNMSIHPQDAFLPRHPKLDNVENPRKRKIQTKKQEREKYEKIPSKPRIQARPKATRRAEIVVLDSEDESDVERNQPDLVPDSELRQTGVSQSNIRQAPGEKFLDTIHRYSKTQANDGDISEPVADSGIETEQEQQKYSQEEKELNETRYKPLSSSVSVGMRPSRRLEKIVYDTESEPEPESEAVQDSPEDSRATAHLLQSENPSGIPVSADSQRSSTFDESESESASLDHPQVGIGLLSYPDETEWHAEDNRHSREREDFLANMFNGGSTQTGRAGSGIATTYFPPERFRDVEHSGEDEAYDLIDSVLQFDRKLFSSDEESD
jgi:hypothetical protein